MTQRVTAFVRSIDLHKHPFMQFYLTAFLTMSGLLAYFTSQPLEGVVVIGVMYASIFATVGLGIHYVTGTLEAESTRLQIAVVVVVLVSAAASTGAVLAFEDADTNTEDVDDSIENSIISREYVGPNITATVTACTDDICNVTVTASDWDYYTVATVTDSASERTWQLTPSANQTSVTVRRNFTNSAVPNTLTVSLPVDGGRLVEIRTRPGERVSRELQEHRVLHTDEDDCVVTAEYNQTCEEGEEEQ